MYIQVCNAVSTTQDATTSTTSVTNVTPTIALYVTFQRRLPADFKACFFFASPLMYNAGFRYELCYVEFLPFYRPQTKFAKVMFLQVSVCPQGGHAWLLWGGMCGCPGGHVWLLGGACVVAPRGGVCLLLEGMRGCSRGGA